MFTGLPDFGRPERCGAAGGYLAHEQPGVLCVVPDQLRPQPLQVDQYLQDGAAGVAQFAVLTAAFDLSTPDGVTSADGAEGVDGAAASLVCRPAPLAGGLVRLVAPADLRVPAAALAPQPFDGSSGQVLPTLVRLDGVAGDLLVGALQAGLLTLGGLALVTVQGVAARCAGTLTLDVAALIEGVGADPLTPSRWQQLAEAGLPGVSVSGGPQDAHLLAEAVLDRVLTRLAEPAFLTDADGTSDGEGGWQLPAGWPPGATFSWVLSEQVEAVRLLRLTCDPVLGAGGAAAVRRHTAPPLPEGRRPLVVHSTLPAMPAGVVAATVRLTAPAVLPDRPFPAETSVHLSPPAPTPATLRLSPGEPLAYDLEAAAVLDSDLGPRTLSGPVRHVDADPTPVLTPADLGLRLIAVQASDSLLALADVTVIARATRATRDPAVLTSRAALHPGAGQAWLAVPRDAFSVDLQAQATSRGAAPRTSGQPLPDAAVWLDPFSFDDPPWADGSDQHDQQHDQQEEQMLVVEAEGLRAAGAKDGTDWQFLPLTAGPARDAAGTPQLTLIDMPGTSMLMVTTALGVSDSAQQALRRACLDAGAAEDVRLSPAPLEVQGSAELHLTDGGQDRVLASAVPSGTAGQDAAFSVSLTGGDIAPVHQALAGHAGLLTVRYRLQVAATGAQAQSLAGGPDPLLVVSDASTWRP